MFTSEFKQRLTELQSRLPERGEASRKALIVSAVGARTARQNPWKGFSKIEGEDDFYSAMNAGIEVSQSSSALHAYLVHLSRDIVGNANDLSWIEDQIVAIATRIAQEETSRVVAAAHQVDAPHHAAPKDAQTPTDPRKKKKTANRSLAISEDKSKADRAGEAIASAQRNHGINANTITVHGDLTIQVSSEPVIPIPNGGKHSQATPNPGSAAAGVKVTKGKKHGSKPPNSKTTNRDPIRECLKTVLDDDQVLAFQMCETLFGPKTPVDTNQTVSRLLEPDALTKPFEDFPLLRFCNLLKQWRDQRIRLPAKTCRRSLMVFKELLMIASFPECDRKIVEGAMLATWSKSGINAEKTELEVGACNRNVVEKLLMDAFARITAQPGVESDLLQLVDPDVLQNRGASHIFRKLKVLSEPTLPPDEGPTVSWYAERCMQALGHNLDKDTDWVAAFQYRLKRHTQDSAVVAMFIARDKKNAIGMLKNAFPELLLVRLAERNAERYTNIYIELDDIDEALKDILIDPPT